MKFAADVLTAGFAILAAVLWIISARAEVWADGQKGAQDTNIVVRKDGRLYDVTATAEKQSKWSAYAAYAAAAAATLQAVSVLLSAGY